MVTGHDAETVERRSRCRADGRFVRNPAYRDGQATSLAAAFHDIADDSEAARGAHGRPAGDHGRRRRCAVEGSERRGPRSCACGSSDGPGPALLSREIYAEAGHLHGDVGARVLIASHPDWVEEVEGRAAGSA